MEGTVPGSPNNDLTQPPAGLAKQQMHPLTFELMVVIQVIGIDQGHVAPTVLVGH